jgi:hypothetical protein
VAILARPPARPGPARARDPRAELTPGRACVNRSAPRPPTEATQHHASDAIVLGPSPSRWTSGSLPAGLSAVASGCSGCGSAAWVSEAQDSDSEGPEDGTPPTLLRLLGSGAGASSSAL